MSGEQEVAHYLAEREKLTKAHAYYPELEHDACGVGLVVAIDGKPRREVVLKGIEALKALWHRGAVDADGATGDGAGIHVEVSQDFFRAQVRQTGHNPGDASVGIGMIFLPRTDFVAQERCRTIVETEILRFGFYIFGWRQVPVDTSVIGEKANATRPDIEQIMFKVPEGTDETDLER
ncbi:MAG: glutamate synthase large subunit, partial [Alphaproteobacteria bacterium]